MARNQRKGKNSRTAASAGKKTASKAGKNMERISTPVLQDKNGSEKKFPPKQKDAKGPEETNSEKGLDQCEQSASSSDALLCRLLVDEEVVPKMPSTLLEQNYPFVKTDSDHDGRDEILSSEKSVFGPNNLEQNTSSKIEVRKTYDKATLLRINLLPIPCQLPKILSDVVGIWKDPKPGMSAFRKESTHPVTNRAPSSTSYSSHCIHIHSEKKKENQTGRKIIEAKQSSKEKVLKTTDNAWKPSSKSSAHGDRKKTILSAITLVLNKICPENYEKLKDSFRENILSNADLIPDIIIVIFDKALLEKYFSAEYASLCLYVVDVSTELSTHQQSPIAGNFKRSLLGKCQHEFQKKYKEETNRQKELENSLRSITNCNDAERKNFFEKEHIDKFADKLQLRHLALQFELKICKDEAKIQELTAEIEELEKLESSSRCKSVGLIKFIAELFRVKFLPQKIILDLHLKLIDAIHNTLLAEMLCTLFFTAAKELWLILTDGEKQQFSKAVDQIRKYVRVTKVIRIKFMLLDVLDFFDSGFVASHKSQQKEGPTTKKEVLEKMHVEKTEFEQKAVTLSNGCHGKRENYQSDNKKFTPHENSDRESYQRFDKIIKSSDNSKRPMIPPPFGVKNDKILTSSFPWNKGCSGGGNGNVSSSTVSSIRSNGASGGLQAEVYNSANCNYAYRNVGGDGRTSEDNTSRYRIGTGNKEMQYTWNFNQNYNFSGRQQAHDLGRQAQEPYFPPDNVLKPQMRTNPFRSNNNMDYLGGQHLRENTQGWNPYRGAERTINSGATDYSFESRNVTPARCSSPQRNALHQPTASSCGSSNHQNFLSRSVAPARGNSFHHHALHQPTATSTGFSKPSNGLANSTHGNEHRPDDGDNEKLKQLCNVILLELYDSKNIKGTVEEIRRRVGARKVATFLEVALQHCIETKPANGELSSSLVAELFTRKMVSAELLTKMLKPTMEQFADLCVDIPQLPTYMARMFSNLLRAGAFSLTEVWTQAQTADSQKHKLFLSILQSLASQNAEETSRIWDTSNLTWETIFTVEPKQRPIDVEDELRRYNLCFLRASGQDDRERG